MPKSSAIWTGNIAKELVLNNLFMPIGDLPGEECDQSLRRSARIRGLEHLKDFEKNKKKFPLTPMGVLAPVSAHARPSPQTPIDVSGNFPAPMSAEWPSNISPCPSKMFQTPTITPCRFSPKLGFCPPKLGLFGAVGGQGGSQNGFLG